MDEFDLSEVTEDIVNLCLSTGKIIKTICEQHTCISCPIKQGKQDCPFVGNLPCAWHI